MGNVPPQLTPFKPGESGNPNGRPKGSLSIKTIARRLADDPKTWDNLPIQGRKGPDGKYVPREQIIRALRDMVGSDRTILEALLLNWISRALTDSRFANIVLELMDGKAKNELAGQVDINGRVDVTPLLASLSQQHKDDLIKALTKGQQHE